jgi:hypothetical protein
MEPMRGAMVVGQEQQAETHLGDQESLRERDQVRDQAVRLTPPQVGETGEHGRTPRRPQDEKCDGVMHR